MVLGRHKVGDEGKMARFSEEWLAKLLEKSDIVDVISEYVPLKRKGANLWATCPWHAEKNPSFSVSPSKQMFYCFSCKRGGGVINFIMEHEKLSYVEAVTLLADRAGMELPEAQEDTGYQQRKEYRKRLYGMMRELALHYHHNLREPSGKAGLEYFAKRKIAGQIGPYGLGFALDSYDDAYQFLLKKGYTLKEMLDAGVVRQREGRVYDFFRNRAIFPIQSHFGDVIAFGGRVMDDSNPKYLNSGETYIFNKRYHLYALNLVKKQRNLNHIILMEGYMDVVALAGIGVKNAVASLGTALTKEQARLLKKFVNTVYLCYDGDEAGQSASERAIPILQAEGLVVLVIEMPDGMDPDDYAKAYGPEGFARAKAAALSAMEFQLKRLQKNYDMANADQVISYATAAVQMIGSLNNELEKERYIRLLSSQTGLSAQSLQLQMGRKPNDEMHNLPQDEQNLVKAQVDDESRLFYLLLESPKLAEKLEDTEEGLFQNKIYQRTFLYMKEQIKKGILPTCAEIISVFPEYSAVFGKVLEVKMPVGVGLEDYAETLLKKLQIGRLEEKRQKLQREISQAQGAKRAAAIGELGAVSRALHELQTKIE